MLSNYTYSKYAINKGYNDDIKLIAPYYFELVSNPVEEKTGYWVFEDCKVELNSMYFNFSSSGPIPPEPINYWMEVYADDKPFNIVDNKWYFVVWRSDTNSNWRIIKFLNNEVNIIIDNFKNYELEKYDLPLLGNDLYIKNKSGIRYVSYLKRW
ncbi:hypothetical protein [Spiroplasma citri]|uniref:hypothetical protein n=1 Tax=Spiroplasma citri TaxID=2133 RepID=UPI00286F65E5|nr:hypothetical protein [Spiroplasma citri]